MPDELEVEYRIVVAAIQLAATDQIRQSSVGIIPGMSHSIPGHVAMPRDEESRRSWRVPRLKIPRRWARNDIARMSVSLVAGLVHR
jgi:hypothetical protein